MKPLALMILACLPLLVAAQKKIVIMGSSTAAGAAASPRSLSWAGRLQDAYRRNQKDGADTVVINLARFGATTYHEMPDGFQAPPKRPAPDTAHNVSKALGLHPDIIILNFASNDISFGYRPQEFMDNCRQLYNLITAAGVRCFITTTQPVNGGSEQKRSWQKALADSVLQAFGPFAIDFWKPLATKDNSFQLREEVRHLGFADSNYHINTAGHALLFEAIRQKQLFARSAADRK